MPPPTPQHTHNKGQRTPPPQQPRCGISTTAAKISSGPTQLTNPKQVRDRDDSARGRGRGKAPRPATRRACAGTAAATGRRRCAWRRRGGGTAPPAPPSPPPWPAPPYAPPPPHARRGEPLLPHPHTLAPPPEPYPRRRRRCDLRRVRWICRRVGVGVGVGRVLERRRERNLKRGGRISMDGMDGWVETRRHETETETETEMERSLFKFSFCFLLVLRIKIWFYFCLLREIGAVELRWA